MTFLEVATNETSNLQAQLANVDIQIRLMNSSVLLIKALGGGWNASKDAAAVTEAGGQLSAELPPPPPARTRDFESAPSTAPASTYTQ